jgi:kinetochore protein Nuf2
MFSQDVASCLDQLRTMEKDIQALDIAKKNLTTTKDLVDQKKIERTELELRIEVYNTPPT